jgi:hypothetical protein
MLPTISKTVNNKKLIWPRKSRFTKWKEWWSSLSEEDKVAYREKKENQKENLENEYKETSKKVERLYENISKMTREDLYNMFKDMTRFHDYSVMNNLFIRAQKSDATTVWGRKKWFSYWYKLKESAKPIYVCAPVQKVVFSKDITANEFKKFKEDPRSIEVYRIKNKIKLNFKLDDISENENWSYKLIIRKTTAEFNEKAKIYDISDVEAIIKDWVDYSKPLNDFTIRCSIEYNTLKNHVTNIFWYTIKEKPMKVSTWWFVVVWDNKNISINSYLDDKQKAGALIHEVSHLILWHTEENHNKAEKGSKDFNLNYAIDEIQAETLAYLFREMLGIESKSDGYIKWYTENNDIWDSVLLKEMKKAIKIFDVNKNKFNNIINK